MVLCLFVDQSPVIRRTAKAVLSDVGLSVVEATDELAALTCCREELPHIVFVDWHLPNAGAITFLKGLEPLSRIRRPLVIATMMYIDPQELEIAKTAGADARLIKPFDRISLLEVLQNCLAAA